ncbi:MAG: hypothetical protein K0S48_2209 [Ramlibacter sp.]|nr:hypothetical protein [Ramlibacter sp.]
MNSTVTSAIDITVTSAVSTLGKRSGSERRQLSIRNTIVLPGRSSSCCAVNTRAPRRASPCMARRVPSASVKEISWLRPICGPMCVDSRSVSEYVATTNPSSRPASTCGRHSSISSSPRPSGCGTK